MAYADNDGISLYYEVDGPENEDTVVLVEGLGYGRWMWNWQRERLTNDGYQVVVWDNRGTGDSDVPDGPYTISQMAGDLEAVLESADIDSAHVVGASMGGMIAQRYALDYDRAESLALLCTSPGGDDAVPTPPETQARMFDVPEDADEREAIRYKMKPAMSDDFWTHNDDLVSDIVDWRVESDAPESAREAQAAAVAGFDASDELANVHLPTLVAHGDSDSVLPVENADLLYEGLLNARLAIFEDGPHLFFIEQAESVNDALVEFVDDA
ncbi:alpha/beta fold hydrolase [Halorussus halophilus]|uniref:alpha/beta fold hydrolase n=1 Tax=Halorussus halophilus TaxID=2650975 RepID=UPI00130184C3|nr:alpha/beta hydrolase [Halorussus halophilus]